MTCMADPSPEAVEAVFQLRGSREAGRESERAKIAKELQAALPIERARWEAEVRERLEALPELTPTTSHGGSHYQERDRWAMVEIKNDDYRGRGYLKRKEVLAIFEEADSDV